MKVRILRSARTQITAARDYLLARNPEAAHHLLDDIESALRRLAEFPDIGHYIPEYPDLPFREIIVGQYRIFYIRQGSVIRVAAVWHGAQQARLPTNS